MAIAPSGTWTTIEQQALQAAEAVLGQKWSTVANGAILQIDHLTSTAQYIALHKDDMSSDEYTAVVQQQKLSLQAVLLTYEEIGIAVAEQVVAAVWQVIGTGLQAAAGIAIK